MNADFLEKFKNKKKESVETGDQYTKVERNRQEAGIEQKESLMKEEKIDKKMTEKDFEKIKISSRTIKKAKKKSGSIKIVNKNKKIDELLTIAQEEGLSFAISAAQNMNDPYILDTFHDILIKNKLYKKFSK